MLQAIAQWDAQVLLFIQSLRTAPGDLFFSLWTSLGNAGLLWIASAVIFLFFPKTRRTGFLALAGLLLNLLAVNCFLKPLVSRDRPWLLLEGLEPLLFSDDPNSFPSGHTSASFAFAAALCVTLEVNWARALALAAAALMGFSRLYAGVHFPTDVLGGAVIGALCGLLAVGLETLIRRKMKC